MIRLLSVILCCVGSPVFAQAAIDGTGGELRVLDKVTGKVEDVTLQIGETAAVGLLNIALDDCRVPRVNPTGDAYAQVTVVYGDSISPAFAGWLIASAPALHAMDHPRYDVWVLRCNAS